MVSSGITEESASAHTLPQPHPWWTSQIVMVLDAQPGNLAVDQIWHTSWNLLTLPVLKEKQITSWKHSVNIISPHSQIILRPDSACGVAFWFTECTSTLSTVTSVALFPCSKCLSPSVLSPMALGYFWHWGVQYLSGEAGQFEKLMGLSLIDSKYLCHGSQLSPGLLLCSSGTLFFRLVILIFIARGIAWWVAALVRWTVRQRMIWEWCSAETFYRNVIGWKSFNSVTIIVREEARIP